MYSTPFVVVDHSDSNELADPSITIPAAGSEKTNCFAATFGYAVRGEAALEPRHRRGLDR